MRDFNQRWIEPDAYSGPSDLTPLAPFPFWEGGIRGECKKDGGVWFPSPEGRGDRGEVSLHAAH